MITHKIISKIIPAVLLIPALSGLFCCKNKDNADTVKAATSIQLSWTHASEFSPFYAAGWNKNYAEYHLEVKIKKGGFNKNGKYIDPLKTLMEKNCDFAVAGADVLLKAREQGMPLIAVGNIYQNSPVILMSKKEKNIISPQDLKGKRVMILKGTTVGISEMGLFASQGIDPLQMKLIEKKGHTIKPLIDDQIDVIPGFVTGDGVQAEISGIDVNIMFLSDYGIDIYTNLIITREEILENNPGLAADFIAATIEGMKWVLNYPDEAVNKLLEEYGDDMEPLIRQIQPGAIDYAVHLMHPAGTRPGEMSHDKWEAIYHLLVSRGIIQGDFNIKDAYTLDYIEDYYSRTGTD